ncbi:MAG: choice-of-anchor R domain-containing protein, partial [Candidatus Paceibacterota bacterium]
MKKDFKKNKNGGMAMLTSVIFFLFISLAIISGLVLPSVREFRNANMGIHSKGSYFLAESGVEDAFYRIIKNMTIGTSETLTLGDVSAITTITDISGGKKEISSLGDMNSFQRKVKLIADVGVGASFSYGVQSGIGGFIMDNGSVVNGSVYSNGNITGSGSITGAALSANSAALVADQENGSGVPDYNISFGNANSTEDFAQSFQISSASVINKVDLYLKKVSTPGNLTVRIVSNSGSSPSATTLASGTLSASLVSTNYGWVSVPFSTNPELTTGTTYWIVIDGSDNASRYYVIGANDNGYANGSSKIGQYGGTWNNNSPSTVDGFFKVYLGGLTGLIDGITVGTGGVGNAYAHTVNNSTIAGTNYCQTGSGNNKECNTSLADPVQVPMPISDQNIVDWKNEAEAGGVYSGNYTLNDATGSIGPKKITGDLTVQNGSDLTLEGILWVQGNMIVNNNAIIRLSSSFGTSDGAIIVDGTVLLENNAS